MSVMSRDVPEHYYTLARSGVDDLEPLGDEPNFVHAGYPAFRRPMTEFSQGCWYKLSP